MHFPQGIASARTGGAASFTPLLLPAGRKPAYMLFNKIAAIWQIIFATILVSTAAHAQTKDPGPDPGTTGKINFTYQGASVTLTTVRAADGNIWLQQNLGSKRVSQQTDDETSFGDLFQWGRWDDSHQIRKPEYTANKELSPNNPSGLKLSGRNPFYYNGLNIWWLLGTSEDQWTATKPEEATANIGCDPCKALGAGWRLPTFSEWLAVLDKEEITNGSSALNSNLKLSLAGARDRLHGRILGEGSTGSYWAGNTPRAKGVGEFIYVTPLLVSTKNYQYRGEGMSIRCIKAKP